MVGRSSSNRGLADFLAELDRRLDALGPGGVVAALQAGAARLLPSERPAFLAMFDDVAASPDDGLLAEIDAFVVGFPETMEELTEHRWRERRGSSDWWDENEESPVSDEVDDLYRRVGERFLVSDWTIAADGYRRLMKASIDDVDNPAGYIVGGSDELVREGMARFVRALLADHSASPTQRAAAVVVAIGDYGSTAGCPSLADVLRSHPARVEDLDDVLVALGRLCEDEARTSPSWNASQFHDLALDVAVEIGGPDALARLARDLSMPRRDRAWARWMNELVGAGRLTDAIGVGAEAIGSIDPSLERARLADQYGSYQRRTGDHCGALATVLVAFSDGPSLHRLRLILDDTESAKQATPLASLANSAGSDPLVRVAVRLLAGRVDNIPNHGDFDCSRVPTTLEASAVGIAALLRTSAVVAGPHVKLCDARIGVLDGARLGRDAFFELRRSAGSEAEPEPSLLGPRVIRVLTTVAPDDQRLPVAAGLIETAAAEVMSNKWRSSYALVAQLVVALAHTTEATGQGSASVVIAQYDRTYRRFAAFRKELQQAAKAV